MPTRKATWYGINTYPICDSLKERDQAGAASLRYRNRAEITFLMYEQMPYPVGFSCQCKSYLVLCEHILTWRVTHQIGILTGKLFLSARKAIG